MAHSWLAVPCTPSRPRNYRVKARNKAKYLPIASCRRKAEPLSSNGLSDPKKRRRDAGATQEIRLAQWQAIFSTTPPIQPPILEIGVAGFGTNPIEAASRPNRAIGRTCTRPPASWLLRESPAADGARASRRCQLRSHRSSHARRMRALVRRARRGEPCPHRFDGGPLERRWNVRQYGDSRSRL